MSRASTFTTFINTALDPDTDRTWERLAQGGERAFSRVTRAAAAAAAEQTAIQRRINAATGVDRSFNFGSGAAEASARAFQDLERRAVALRSAMDPLYASQARYNVELAEARGLLEAGAISTAEFTTRQTQLRDRLNATTVALGRGARSAGEFRAAQQNLSFQIADVAQGLALGVNPAIVFGQQASQTAAALAGMGGTAGRVGAFLSGPWGLAITAAATVTGLLAGKFFENRDAANEASNAIAEFARRQSDITNFIDQVTGKLTEQNRVLVLNAILTRQATIAENEKKVAAERTRAFEAARATRRQEFVAERQPARTVFDVDVEAAVKSANGSVERLAETIGRLATTTRPDLAGLAKEITTIGSSAILAERDNARLGRELAALNGNTSALASSSAALVQQRVALATASTPLERAQARYNQVLSQGAAAERAGGDALKKYETALTSAKLAVDRARDAETALNRARTQNRRDERAAASAAEQLTRDQVSAEERVKRIREEFDDQPRLVDRAAQATRELDRYIDKFGELTDARSRALVADAEARKGDVEVGARRPIQQMLRDFEDQHDLQLLRLQGYDREAAALERTLGLIRSGAAVRQDDYARILDSVREEERINDLLTQRERLTSALTGAVDETRNAFEAMLIDLPRRGPKAAGDFLKSLQSTVNRLVVRQITNRLFAGADKKVLALIDGTNGADAAATALEGVIGRTGSALDDAGSAAERFAKRLDGLATGSGAGLGSTVVGANATNILNAARNGLSAVSGGVAAGGAVPEVTAGGDIVVTAPRAQQRIADPSSNFISGRQFVTTVTNTLVDNLGKLGVKLPKATGEYVGKAFEGAGVGTIAAGLTKALGIKTSTTGAQIGGAIGKLTGIPGADVAGAIWGGIIGGALKKTKKSSTTLSLNDFGEIITGATTGTSKGRKKTAETLGGAVGDQLRQIADSLDGELTDAIGVSIGTRNKKFVVDTTGQGRTKGAGVEKFKDQQEAIAFALQNAIEDGVLTGISAASQKILKSGQNLQRALEKATAIESIPKRLLQLTDPVRFAVTELNDEFEKLIGYLKEGGATAEQFADAQKLYDLERARAIKDANGQAASALDDFLKEMTGGSSSPLSKRQTYGNARSQLDAFVADINGGRNVDQQDLLSASRNFQDASRALNGSSQAAFDDFDYLFNLLSKARSNATAGASSSPLPGSPFDSGAAVTQAISSSSNAQVTATKEVTNVLSGRIDQLNATMNKVLEAVRGGRPSSESSIKLLAGFQR